MKCSDLYTEPELVILLSKNSPIAFRLLFERYSRKIYRFSFSYVKSEAEAEEIVQEVFMKIWENRAGLKSEKSFQAYLFTIAFNAIKKQFNKKMKAEKYRYDIFESLTGDVPSLESRLDFEKLLEKLDRIIDELPERRKKIFLMRKKEGKSVNDIANELGVSPKTVENQITEAMHALKKAFSSDDLSSLLFYILFVS